MALTLRRDDVQMRHFQPERAVVLPAGSTTKHIIYPTQLPLHPVIALWLEENGNAAP